MYDIIELTETFSTNTYLANLIDENTAEGTVVFAHKQKKGRGQRTNIWESEDDKNLTFSILLKPNINIENAFLISKAVSVGIIEYLKKLDKEFQIKWPNDIYYQNKKLAGILIENKLNNNIISEMIVGIGININQEKFISDAPNPISLKNIFNKEFELKKVLSDIIKNIMIWYNKVLQNNINEVNRKYHSYLYRTDSFYNFEKDKNIFKAKIIKVNNDGKIIMKTDDNKTIGFYFNEVTFIH